jgi:protein TonB
MKDRTLLLSAFIACAVHALVLWVNFGVSEPILASTPTMIEVTLVAPPAAAAEPAPVPPAPEPEPPPPEPEPEPAQPVAPPPPLPEPEPEPEIAMEPVPLPEPVTIPQQNVSLLSESSQVVEENRPHVASPQAPVGATRTDGETAPTEAAVDVPTAYMRNPKPAYPQRARQLGQQGRVELLVEVLANGRVGRVDISASSGYDILDQAAADAVKRWRFVPARRGRRPVTSWVRIPVKFDLRERL